MLGESTCGAGLWLIYEDTECLGDAAQVLVLFVGVSVLALICSPIGNARRTFNLFETCGRHD